VFAYNSKYNLTIRILPIEVVIGEKPNFLDSIRDLDSSIGKTTRVSAYRVPAVVTRVERIVADRAKIRQYIEHAQSL